MRIWLAGILLMVAASVNAQDLYMARSQMAFPETMIALQKAIKVQGYTLSRVQRVDIGLTKSGFKTDRYRVVFFGKPEEIRELGDRYLDLVPYLPLKIAIFAEGDETLLLASSFEHLRPFYTQADIRKHFDVWETDLQHILEQVRLSE
ncbi:hypothetical protein DFR30_0044 [Thiogranum longum]|uniref:DUF302 domain-containing protein n=1 Tax=Thiogranum longum TaxID=1537524 RepID=A0A4R1H9L0_9GAMM|nr:DUF302 domain-containing protein [Thiogranum longum]TCK16825.1 hypothetical protein DFR30_0044 [Thiogranum longum]